VIFGVAIAGIVSMIIAEVPLVGGLLASFLTPLMLAFGIGGGALRDLCDGAFGDRVRGLVEALQDLVRGA